MEGGGGELATRAMSVCHVRRNLEKGEDSEFDLVWPGQSLSFEKHFQCSQQMLFSSYAEVWWLGVSPSCEHALKQRVGIDGRLLEQRSSPHRTGDNRSLVGGEPVKEMKQCR